MDEKNTAPAAYSGEQKYIFASYSHKDSEMVMPILRELKLKGFRIWYDEGIYPSNDWEEVIGGKIIDCSFFIAFLSENYKESEYSTKEIKMALEERITILPIYLQKTSLKKGMRFQLTGIQYLDAYDKDIGALICKIVKIPEIIACRDIGTIENKTPDELYAIGVDAYQNGSFDLCIRYWKSAAEQGCVDAACSLGMIYSTGHLVKKDTAAASDYFEKAANQGSVEAKYGLSMLLMKNEQERAIGLLKDAAYGGNSDAQYTLGRYYEEGQYNLPKLRDEAYRWYWKASKLGHHDAQYRLACILLKTKENGAAAVRWLTEAANADRVLAQYRLGLCYEKGIGVLPDRTEAIMWYEKAAAQGNANAKKRLAHLKS